MTQVQVDKNALQKLSQEYRSIASRLLRSNSDDGDANLARFTDFIDRNPVIRNFVEQEFQSAGIESDPELERDESGRWALPLSPDGEFVFVYALFRAALSDDLGHDYTSIARGYDSQSGNQDRNIEAFHRAVVLPFAQRIEHHIVNLLREAAGSDDQKISITVSDGSIYVAGNMQGSNAAAKAAAISDSTASYSDSQTLAQKVEELYKFLDEIPAENRDDAKEAIEVLISSASGQDIDKPELAKRVDFLGRVSPKMREHLASLLVNVSGSVTSHLLIQTIMFIFGTPG